MEAGKQNNSSQGSGEIKGLQNSKRTTVGSAEQQEDYNKKCQEFCISLFIGNIFQLLSTLPH